MLNEMKSRYLSGKKIFCLTIVLLFSSICLAGEWNLTGSLNHGRNSFSSGSDNGDVLVAGGIANCIVLSSCEIYGSAIGIWEETDSMTFARRDFPLVKFRHNGVKKFLATGGTASLVAEIFDFQSPTWEETGSMHYWRLEASGMAFPDPNNNENDLILIVGGDCENDYTTCEIYNPSTGFFTLTGPLLEGKCGSRLVYNPELNVIMAIGGWGTNGIASLHDCQIYDIATGIWTQAAPTNYPHEGHTANFDEGTGTVLVVGSSYSPLNGCELYDFATEEWAFVSSLEIGRTGHCSEKLLNGKIIAMGGTVSGADPRCEIYNYLTNEWQTATSTYYPYGNFSTEILNDERVLAIRSWCELYTWNYQPIVSQPQSPGQGSTGDVLNFSVTASDPDDDSIAVRINWGDEEISEWTELQPSGTTFEFYHAWSEPGEYEVCVQTADQWYFLNELCHNSISEWTEPVIITITGIPEIEISTDSLNFGTVYIGEDSLQTITISNLGNGILETDLSTNTDEFSVYPTTYSIDPGETLDIEITFTPTYEGTISDTLTILSNDPENPEVEIALVGEGEVPVSVDDNEILSDFIGNYPNPFNPTTTISFSVTSLRYATPRQAEIKIYNIKGQKVRTFPNLQINKSSNQQILWDGKDENNLPVGSGIYFYQLIIGDEEIASRKMLLLR